MVRPFILINPGACGSFLLLASAGLRDVVIEWCVVADAMTELMVSEGVGAA